MFKLLAGQSNLMMNELYIHTKCHFLNRSFQSLLKHLSQSEKGL